MNYLKEALARIDGKVSVLAGKRYHILKTDMEILKDEVERLEADAERYRWLKYRGYARHKIAERDANVFGGSLDSHIDAAMEQDTDW